MGRHWRIGTYVAVLAMVALINGAAIGQTGHTLGVVVGNVTNPFGGYMNEILKTEGFRSLHTESLAGLTLGKLQSYGTIVLTDTSLTTSQADMFRSYVSGGGNLIAMRPDSKLDDVFGLVRTAGTVSEGYVKIEATPLGSGLETSTTLKMHGTADLYGVASSATKVASLYSSASANTGYAAVVRSSYGAGQAVAYAYDLAKSTVYLRQGNPNWAGEEHDGSTGIKTNDLFYDQATNTYWNGPNRDGILQADEQMRLLSHAIEATNASKMPVPRLWYFPNAEKSVTVWTGDQDGAQITRFNDELSAVRARGGNVSFYVLNPQLPLNGNIGPRGPMPSTADVAGWLNGGNEISIHFDDTAERSNPTWAKMNAIYDFQLADFHNTYPTAPAPRSLRNHYVVWLGKDAGGAKEFAAQALIEQNHGFQLDFNYYYQRLAGQGSSGRTIPSGLPMRFATSKGQILDIFQADSQVTDEILADAIPIYKNLIDASLYEGKYSWVVVNSHPVSWSKFSDTAGQILDYAVAKGVPIWSGGQMNSFLQMRDAANFENMQWDGSNLSFTADSPVAGYGALTVMVPAAFNGQPLLSVLLDDLNTSYVVETIAGSDYALFTIGGGMSSVRAIYVPEPATSALLLSAVLGLLAYAWLRWRW